MTFQDNIYQIADELRAVASLGLHFAEEHRAREPRVDERYENVLTCSARLIGMPDQRPLAGNSLNWPRTSYTRSTHRRGAWWT